MADVIRAFNVSRLDSEGVRHDEYFYSVEDALERETQIRKEDFEARCETNHVLLWFDYRGDAFPIGKKVEVSGARDEAAGPLLT